MKIGLYLNTTRYDDRTT